MQLLVTANDTLFNAVTAVLDAGSEPDTDGAERQRRLSAALEYLMSLMERVETTYDNEDHPEPQTDDYGTLRSLVSQRFPDLDYYDEATGAGPPFPESLSMVADAVDDLADIRGDLRAAIWRRDNTCPTDAVWHLKLSFDHWGRHAAGLLRHLAWLSNGL